MEIKEDKRSKMEIDGDKDQYILWMYSKQDYWLLTPQGTK